MCSRVFTYRTFCSVLVSSSLRPHHQPLVRPDLTRNLCVHFVVRRNIMTSGLKLSWQIEVSDIPEQVEALIAKTRAVYDTVGAVPQEKGNYNNIIKVSVGTLVVGWGGGCLLVSAFSFSWQEQNLQLVQGALKQSVWWKVSSSPSKI